MTAARPHPVVNPALRLAEQWQRGFPLCREPYRRIGGAHELTAAEVMTMLGSLMQSGALARIGAAVRPNTVGASTLAALRAPPERLDEIAALVSREPCVNHNYEREHAYNLWFVAAGRNRAEIAATLQRIGQARGCDVIDLPLERAYHLDLGFALSERRKPGGRLRATSASCGNVDTEEFDRTLRGALSGGLDLVHRPYLHLAARIGCNEQAVLARLRRLVSEGVISRFGCILRHRRIGISANAMAVWSVPDRDVDRLGQRLAKCDAVTLCYRRTRHLPGWPYNLFAMIHGRERATVENEIAISEKSAGLSPYPSTILFSRRCFKQEAARYGDARGLAA